MLTDVRREGSHELTEVSEHGHHVLWLERELLLDLADLVRARVTPTAAAEKSLHLNDQLFAPGDSFELEAVETRWRRRVWFVVLSVLEDAYWGAGRFCLPLCGRNQLRLRTHVGG